MLKPLFIALQFILPQHLLTALIWRIARIRHVATKDFLITRFIDSFDVKVDDVKLQVPGDFANFNEFFIRELSEGARPVDEAANSIVSPVDGTVSVAARLQKDMLIQAKGLFYSLDDLLATDLEQAQAYVNGIFTTIYLAPFNYHRVHAPLSGELVAASYVPGDLFSVNQTTVERVDGLFRRNERLIMHFKTAQGPAALVFVGALNVGSISTPWSGEIRPRKNGVAEALSLGTQRTEVNKGDLLGWFNMGSTVILLMPDSAGQWHDNLTPGTTLSMGEAIGELKSESP